jgi:hypothetical protein
MGIRGRILRIPYDKVDPWIKKNPEARYKDFITRVKNIPISIWSFEKRRRVVLKLPLTPSMQQGYRSSKVGPSSASRNSCVYSTVLSLPATEIEGKKSVEIIQTLIDHLNDALSLGLEAVQITAVGDNTQMIEIRRYSK